MPINPTSLGGGFNGISPKQTVLNYKSGGETTTRRILRNSWNTAYASGSYNGYARVITPFRAVNNSGDFLARQNYKCGGSCEINAGTPGMVGAHRNGHRGLVGLGNSIPYTCDTTGVPGGSGNSKWVYDSSDYVTFKRQQAMNTNYNDRKNGGDDSNGSYVFRMHVHRF